MRGVCRGCRAGAEAALAEKAAEDELLAQDEGLVEDLRLLSGQR